MMNDRTKKILFIVGFVIITILLAWALYSLFFSSSVIDNVPVNNANQPVGGLPSINNGGTNRVTQPSNNIANQSGYSGLPSTGVSAQTAKPISEITDQPVQSVTVGSQGEVAWYDQGDGKFYKLQSGQVQSMSDKTFPQAEAVSWSPQADKAIVEYPDGYNILYDFVKQKQISLPKEMTDFTFSGSGQQIAAKVVTDNPDNNWIVTANYDGSGLQFIEHIGDKSRDVQMDWSPAGEIIATYREGVDFERQEVYPIGQSGSNIKSLKTDGRGFVSKWSPQGNLIVYSVYNSFSGYRPVLYVADMGGDWTGSYYLNLGLQSWPDKCVFNSTSQKLYCAVPDDLPELSGIYPELADDSSDIFYEINLSTGNKRILPLATGSDKVQATDLRLSANEDKLYFINKETGRLTEINLR
ncbi:MAG: hypothetical protein ACKKL5_00675 [Candidatus Komeilibacteria bacterium]